MVFHCSVSLSIIWLEVTTGQFSGQLFEVVALVIFVSRRVLIAVKVLGRMASHDFASHIAGYFNVLKRLVVVFH